MRACVFPQMVFSALALAQCEVIWYFQHVGVASSKSKTARAVLVDIVSIYFFIFSSAFFAIKLINEGFLKLFISILLFLLYD